LYCSRVEAIGEVEVSRVPLSQDENKLKLWIWIHPSDYEYIMSLFIALLQLEVNTMETDTNGIDRKEDENQPIIKKSTIKKRYSILVDRINQLEEPTYSNSSLNVTILCLKDTINRFRLRGPKAITVLKSVLIPSDIKRETKEPHWYNDNTVDLDGLLNNHQIWQNMSSGSKYKDNFQLPIVVRDPRVMLPKKKCPVAEDVVKGVMPINLPQVLPNEQKDQ